MIATAKPAVAILRGEALNPYEMQSYVPLTAEYDLLAVGRSHPLYEVAGLGLPTRLLHAMSERRSVASVGRRIDSLIGIKLDVDRLLGLEKMVADRPLLHSAETFLPVSEQAAEIVERGTHRLILTCWETIPFLHDEDMRLACRKVAVKSATSKFLAVTNRARDALMLEGIASDRVTVIGAAVDCDRFTRRPKSMVIRGEWRVPDNATVILYVGRLIQEKGVIQLLEAFASEQRRNTYLIYVGNGDQQSRIKSAASTLGVADLVRVLPGIAYSFLPELYASADIVAAPSLPTPYWEEQFGMVLVEAMACGRPLITTDSGAIPEVVGDAARVVPPYDISALSEALSELLADEMLRTELSSAGFVRARERYAVPVIASRIARTYAEVLAI